jgi:gamma-glutamyl hercynylcysteine S-oxide synthase
MSAMPQRHAVFDPKPLLAIGEGMESVLGTAMTSCREATLARVIELDDAALSTWPDPAFSPIGWHLGHIAYSEALWLNGGEDPRAEWGLLFRQDGLPKAARAALPPREALLAYLAEVRVRSLARLAAGPLGEQARLWHFILQHEAQHAETIAVLRRLLGFDMGATAPRDESPADDGDEMIEIAGGAFQMGHDGIEALDNERPSRRVAVAPFRISRRPLTKRLYREFIAAGGYGEQQFWSAEGWAWRQASKVEGPLYGCEGEEEAVFGISAYEAEACCRYLGARLPSEAEWEYAARRHPALGRLGEVWQWTASAFASYPGFAPYPYAGYSAAYFDGRHRVLKGGSWASAAPLLRPSFRNWYEPGMRQIFAGCRYVEEA